MLTDGERSQLIDDLEEELPDTCTITRASDDAPVFDSEYGTYEDPEPTTLYESVACRAAPWVGDRVVQAGEQPVTLRAYNVTLPVSVTGLEVDDLIEITDSAEPELDGKVLRIKDPRASSMGVQRRVTAEDDLG